MNYYVAIVNKDSPSVVKNLMKLATRGEKTIAAVIYKDALMDEARRTHGKVEVNLKQLTQEQVVKKWGKAKTS